MIDLQLAQKSLPELKFALPGEWWQVPLHDEVSARASIRRLIDARVGRADEHSLLRDSMRRQLFDGLAAAIEGDGQSMTIALDVIEGVPFSASFTLYLPPLGMTPAVGTAPAEVMRVLEAGLAAMPDLHPETVARFATTDSEVLRTHHIRQVAAADEDDAGDALPTLVAQYWLTIPETKRVILIVFSTVFVDLEQVMLDFFDSIVRALRWEDQDSST
ncbi:hypothetical protein I6E52_03940 [Salinibacterium sp. NG253]|uniref:hypothetical protein n=1 Tax=Salinibacterium sp. NG253 TaxID=2792039 RepID=UPI0018CDEF6C|nr:hypothetical protein [Salinibacterium sp. NG253]MBH0115991.1 hypothetical protein [Salinibacterium sp. NG253]